MCPSLLAYQPSILPSCTPSSTQVGRAIAAHHTTPLHTSISKPVNPGPGPFRTAATPSATHQPSPRSHPPSPTVVQPDRIGPDRTGTSLSARPALSPESRTAGMVRCGPGGWCLWLGEGAGSSTNLVGFVQVQSIHDRCRQRRRFRF